MDGYQFIEFFVVDDNLNIVGSRIDEQFDSLIVMDNVGIV